MKTRILSLAAGVVALASVLAAPVNAEVPITINAGIGQWYFDNDRNLDDTATPWVSLEYAFDDNWAAELFYAEDKTNYRGGADADVSTWQLDMLYYGGSYVGGPNRVRPYVAFGMGEIDIDSSTFDTVETTANLGAGLRWMLTPRFGARIEARVLHSFDEHHNDILMTAGLNYYFGKVSADAAPAVAAAPVDSDGDGVTDDRDQCPGTPAGTRVDANGCPLPVERVASIKLKVNFAFDSANVQERYFSDIKELAEFLKRFDDVDLSVEGHTDSTGPESYNQKLSQRRAQAVVDVLVNQHGIDRSRLVAKGFGESRPVASNDTKEGRAENRRTMATLEVKYAE
ncbi:OmpA family protein [Parahaliea sp. F7430]|uniref:OmpA family protein n=1 Tax=Sediminihaliea albiluteola TaxID=2758564 RepID=A0A7W2YJZ5_9GAMM|nr:OmpA family protein [Sediminihaliea albiluteola]MBA6412803.1 OmpA family protein [Sediminihaliea albiluteola]